MPNHEKPDLQWPNSFEEMRWALEAGRNIVLVAETDERHGKPDVDSLFCFQAAIFALFVRVCDLKTEVRSEAIDTYTHAHAHMEVSMNWRYCFGVLMRNPIFWVHIGCP